jgi:hypothetical protein
MRWTTIAWTAGSIMTIAAAGCGSVDTRPDASGSSDAAPDAPVAACDRGAAFGEPVPLTTLNTAAHEYWAWFSADRLRVYYDSGLDLFHAARTTPDGAFGAPSPLAALNTDRSEGSPVLTADEQTIFFARTPVEPPNDEIFVATRNSTAVAFGAPELLLNVNDAAGHDLPTWVNADGTVMYIGAQKNNEWNIYRTERSSPDAAFATPELVSALNAPGDEDWGAVLTGDELTVYFESLRVPTLGSHDIYVATRSTADDGFRAPVKVTELSTEHSEWPVWVSPDGCHLAFTSTRPGGGGGGYDLWMASKP